MKTLLDNAKGVIAIVAVNNDVTWHHVRVLVSMCTSQALLGRCALV